MLTTGYEFQYALMAAPFAAEIPILFSEKNSLSSYTKKALIDLGIEEVEIIGGSNVISDSILSEINNMGIYAYRIGGNSLEDVNMNIIKKYDPSPDKMALARNDLFPDALSGAAFALKNDAKIFLVGSNSVAPTLKSFILNLNTTENYIFGGPVAVSNSVVNELIPPTINVPPIQIIPDINIPDLDIQVPGLVSTAGNTPGNISNYGFAAIKGDWIYFTLNEGLFKVKKDGSSLDKLCDGLPLYLNVVGDFVYFSDSNDQGHMYKVKTDGTGKTKLTDDKVEDISVLGNWIYYKNKSDSMPYKVKIDGTGRTKIGVFGVRRMVISGGWIYFMTTGSTEYVDRMKMDGTGVEEIVKKDVRFFNVAGDYIYYANGDDQNKIYKAKISSSNVDTKISDNSAFMLNVVGDYIYYGKDVNQESRIYRMKIDGTGNTKFNDINSGYPNIVGEWIYYVQNVSNQSKFYRIKLDGTQNQSIQVQTP
jgi:hypothetical protein